MQSVVRDVENVAPLMRADAADSHLRKHFIGGLRNPHLLYP